MKYSNKELPPLYYAIILHFLDGNTDSAQCVVDALMKDYGRYKLLNIRDVEEALATAKENGLLDETNFHINEDGELMVDYQMSEFGKEMVRQYIK